MLGEESTRRPVYRWFSQPTNLIKTWKPLRNKLLHVVGTNGRVLGGVLDNLFYNEGIMLLWQKTRCCRWWVLEISTLSSEYRRTWPIMWLLIIFIFSDWYTPAYVFHRYFNQRCDPDRDNLYILVDISFFSSNGQSCDQFACSLFYNAWVKDYIN